MRPFLAEACEIFGQEDTGQKSALLVDCLTGFVGENELAEWDREVPIRAALCPMYCCCRKVIRCRSSWQNAFSRQVPSGRRDLLAEGTYYLLCFGQIVDSDIVDQEPVR